MIVDFLIAFLIALVITWFFSVAVGTTGPWSGFWVFFLLILLFSWTMGLWVRPMGPALWGVYWLPYVVFGVVLALVIAAATPLDDRPRRGSRVPRSETPEEAAVAGTVVAVSMFLWIALVVMAVAIVAAYLF